MFVLKNIFEETMRGIFKILPLTLYRNIDVFCDEHFGIL